MPLIDLRPIQYETNLRQLQTLRGWLNARIHNQTLSFIKRDLLEPLFQYGFNKYLRYRNSDFILRSEYVMFNEIFNSSYYDDLSFCNFFIEQLKIGKGSLSLDLLSAKAKAYLSVFGSRISLRLIAPVKDKNADIINTYSLTYVERYLRSKPTISVLKEKILLDVLEYAKLHLTDASHYEMVNLIFCNSDLPDILFCNLVLICIENFTHQNNVLRQDLYQYTFKQLQLLSQPYISDVKMLTMGIMIATIALYAADINFYGSSMLMPSAFLICLGFFAVKELLVAEQVEVELLRRVRLSDSSIRTAEYKNNISAFIGNSKKHLLTRFSRFKKHKIVEPIQARIKEEKQSTHSISHSLS